MDLPNKHQTTPPTPAKKKIEPVVSGVVQVPRPATRRFLDYMFAESPKALGAKVAKNVILPRFKSGVEEALNNFLAGMLWGAGGSQRPTNMITGNVMRAGGVAYHNITAPNVPVVPQVPRGDTGGNYQDLVCPSQEKAEMLLANMYDLFNQYRVVTVADLYELAGITTTPSDNSYGWLSLDGARLSHVRDGYLLELPRPKLI